MDKFKESLTNILKSMVPSKESRQDTVDKFKSAFRTDPTKILTEISKTSKKSFVLLQAIQENIDRMREIMDDSKEDKKGGFLSKLIKGILSALGITLLFKSITSLLSKFPVVAGQAIKGAFKGLGKLITVGVVAGLSGIVAVLKGLTSGLAKMLGLKLPTTTPNINPNSKSSPSARAATTGPLTSQTSKLNPPNKSSIITSSSGPQSRVNKPGAIVIPASSKARSQVQQSSMKAAATGPLKPDAKDVAKLSAKSLGKSALKKIPGLGLLAGIAFGVDRAMGGDLKGAGMEVTSGLAGLFPGFGTAASIATDAALLKHDLDRGSDSTKVEVAKDTMNQVNPNITNQGVGVASPVMVNQRSSSKTIKDSQTQTEVLNTTSQNGTPLTVVNNNTNNVANNNTTVANKTKPRNTESALEREISRHSNLGIA